MFLSEALLTRVLHQQLEESDSHNSWVKLPSVAPPSLHDRFISLVESEG